MNNRDRLVLFALMAAGPLCGFVLGSAGIPVPLSITAGLLLVLALPGYALQRALIPGDRLDLPTSLGMTLGLSLTLCILGGFVLNGTPAGLSAPGWGVLLGGGTLVLALIAWVRFEAQERHLTRTPATDLPAVTASVPDAAAGRATARRATARIPRYQLAMLGLSIALVVVALGVARSGVDRQPQVGYAELWLLEAPTGSVRVGFSNHEGGDRTYRLEVNLNGVTLQTLNSVALADGAQTEQVLQLPAPVEPAQSPRPGVAPSLAPEVVTAALYHQGDPAPYRTARVTIVLP